MPQTIQAKRDDNMATINNVRNDMQLLLTQLVAKDPAAELRQMTDNNITSRKRGKIGSYTEGHLRDDVTLDHFMIMLRMLQR